MKMNVWEQIRLFLGDLSLAAYGRDRKQTQNKKDGGEEKQLLFPSGKRRTDGEIND